MASLIVEHDGRIYTFDGSRPVTIGRDAGADVVCTNAAVSRTHLTVTLDAGRWMVVDQSSLGTYQGSEKISRLAVDRPVTLSLGGDAGGEAVRLSVDDPFARPLRLDNETVQVSGDLAAQVDALTVRYGDQVVSVRAGETLTIGRDVGSGLVVDDPIVSRHHARISQRGERWVLADVGSSRGTYVDGQRVPQHDIVGKATVRLGDPSGPELSFVVGERQRRSEVSVDKRTLRRVIPAVAVAVLLLGGLAFLLFGRGSSGPGLDRAKRAMVWLEVSYPGSNGAVTGSGAILSKDGLILTSAHVVARDAPGLAPSYPPGSPDALPEASQAATEILVYTYVSDDEIERSYRAQVVEVDGYLDLAIIKIDSTAEGAAVSAEELDLDHTSLGDSDELAAGDQMTVLGFPDRERANSVTVASDEITGFQADERKLIEDRRAWILGSSVKVRGGSSGGALVADDGRVYGITTEIREDSAQVFYRPSELARPLFEAAREDSGGGYGAYQYVQRKEPGMSVELRGLSRTMECPDNPLEPQVRRTTGVPVVCLDYDGVTPGQAIFVSVGASEEGDDLGGAWQLFTPANLAESGGGTAAFPTQVPPEALADPELMVVWVRVGAGPNFDELESISEPFPIILK